MRAPDARWTGAALVAVVSLWGAACGGGAREEPQASPRPAAGAADTARTADGDTARVADATGADTSRTAELEAIYEARLDSARMRFTEADVEFMRGMIGHHAQALVMSRLAPTHGASPAIRTLAARIINAQKDEIATMQAWLRERGQPVPEVEIDGLSLKVDGVEHGAGPEGRGHVHAEGAAEGARGEAHAGHGTAHAMDMPGMLTAEQLRELDRAREAEFDRLFLEYMIQHHSGAVTMVHDLFATDGAAQGVTTFKLASDIRVDQATEIDRMELMLSQMSDDTRRERDR